MEYGLLFLLGLAFGSFLNVVIYRLRYKDSPMRGRSYCDHCRKKIAWYDNIPLLSFLWLKGRCRFCKGKISWGYPMMELLIGLQFVWVYWLLKINFNFFNTWEGFYSLALLVYWLILFSGSIAIAVYDIKYLEIPDEVWWPLLIVSSFRLLVSSNWSVIWAAFLAAGFLLCLWLVTHGKGMGFGDVKLGFLLGLVLGWPRTLVALFLAFLTGAIGGVILVLIKKSRFKSKIAFGPFLILAMLVAKIWGFNLWQWYIGLLL